MEYKYTNEALRGRKNFKSQFEMVRHAISLAENMILSGREPFIKTDTQNKALQVLAEIAAGKDIFEPIIVPEQKTDQEKMSTSIGEAKEPTVHKTSERKKPRKILSE